jgi:hypothetical protein
MRARKKDEIRGMTAKLLSSMIAARRSAKPLPV